MNGGAKPRVSSPAPGRSILITSAPRSPSIWAQVGPARTRVRSNTRRPFNGPEGWGPLGLVMWLSGLSGDQCGVYPTIRTPDLENPRSERLRPRLISLLPPGVVNFATRHYNGETMSWATPPAMTTSSLAPD